MKDNIFEESRDWLEKQLENAKSYKKDKLDYFWDKDIDRYRYLIAAINFYGLINKGE